LLKQQIQRLCDRYCNQSIRTYLILINLLLFFLLLPSLGLIFWNKANELKNAELTSSIKTIQSSLKTRGSSLIRSLSLSANQSIASYDYSFLNDLIRQVTANDKEIRYCLMMNKQGIAVAHSNQSLVGDKLTGSFFAYTQILLSKQFPATSHPASITPVEFISQPEKNTMEVVAPVYNGSYLWGALRCAFSLRSLNKQITETENKWQKSKDQFSILFLIIVACFLVLGTTISLFFTNRFERAVAKINHGVGAVANGDLEYQIQTNGLLCSEFHTLSASINQMTNKLHDSRQELDKYNTSLEVLVTERTQELENTNKELEAFSYSVSHDLRAPLRRIDGFSKILITDYEDKLDSDAVDCLQRVRNATLRMNELIDSMLMLSRVSRSPLNYSRINITDVANEIILQLRENEPLRIVETKVASNILANGDPILIMSVLENLIGNAWKYTSKKQLAIIEIGVLQNDGPVYYIKDNGAGFNMEYSDKLFGTFQRLHKDTDFSGTGVGLATVQRIIHRHGGHIWAEAELDSGATFYFTLAKSMPHCNT